MDSLLPAWMKDLEDLKKTVARCPHCGSLEPHHMAHASTFIVAFIERCRRRRPQARTQAERDASRAEEEGLRDALLDSDHTHQYRDRPPAVFERYAMSLEEGKALIRLACEDIDLGADGDGPPMAMKPTLMSWLQLRPEFHRVIRRLKLVEIASALLALRPLRRRLPHGTEYRVRYGESLLMADEIFRREVYKDPFEAQRVCSFIDLGSNVGYFTCYALDRTGPDVVGLAVDANPAMAKETQWHVARSGRAKVQGLWGVVGYPIELSEAPFFLNPSNISGSATVLNPNIPAKGAQKEITVPTVDLDRAWRDHAGDLPVDVMKVDVEGYELKVLETIPTLLRRTNTVVLEWHKWITELQPIDELLAKAGLQFVRVVTEDPHCGVAFYTRSSRLSCATARLETAGTSAT